MTDRKDINLGRHVQIDVERLAAFWREYDNPHRGNGIDKDDALDSSLRQAAFDLGHLQSLERPRHTHKGSTYLLGNKSWFSRLKIQNPPSRELWIVESFLYLFGIDISEYCALEGASVNRFEFFNPRPANLRLKSNRPDRNGRERFSVTLPHITLTDVEIEVHRQDGSRAGIIQAWLDHVSVELFVGADDLEEPVSMLEAGVADTRGKISRYDLIYNPAPDRPACWSLRAEQRDMPIRSATATNVHLCGVLLKQDEQLGLVWTTRSDGFQFVFVRGKSQSPGSETTRAQVFAQILKKRRGVQLLQDSKQSSLKQSCAPDEVILTRQSIGKPR